MIGFVTSSETADVVLAGIEGAQISRGLQHYWSTGAYPIHSGPHAGQTFIPASDEILATPLRGTPALTPRDFPEFDQLAALLGGLDARVDVDPTDFTSSSEP